MIIRSSVATLVAFLAACSREPAPPNACPSKLIVSDSQVRLLHMEAAGRNDLEVIVVVKNTGRAPQPNDVVQHLDMIVRGDTIGTESIPALRAGQRYS